MKTKHKTKYSEYFPDIDLEGTTPLGRDLIEGLQEAVLFERGILTEADGIEVTTYEVPAEPDVKSIREKIGLTQEQFTQFGFSLSTLRSYEQKRRKPTGPARALLKVIEEYPEMVLSALAVKKLNKPAKG